jgi:ATP-dependent exoDNAse (exonuclease V) beta subunit
LLKSVIWERLARFLENERENPERAVEEILYLESRFEDRIPLSVGEVKFKYIVDRVDQLKDGTIMIVDYKTGSIDQMPKSFEHIARLPLTRETIRESVKSFQIPLYVHYLNKKFPQQKINAALYNLRTLKLNTFLDVKTAPQREEINAVFLKALDYIIKEICDPNVEFIEEQTDNIF